MNQKAHKSSIIRTITTFAVVGVLGAVLGWGVLQLSPKAYVPVRPANPDQVSPYLTHTLGPDFYNQVQLYEPFELIIDQAGLNDILARGMWPRRHGQVKLFSPMVRFDTDTIYLMSRIDYRRLSSILTLTARPVMDKKGHLNLNIRSVRLGLVPMTTAAARIAEKAVDAGAAELDQWPQLKPIVHAIIDNTAFEPVIDFDEQTVRLDGFHLEPGRLRVRLIPEHRKSNRQ